MLQAAFITRRTLLQSCCATRPSAPPALHTSAPLEKLYTAWRWTPWPRCFKTMKSRRASIWLWRKSRFPVRYLYRRPGSYEGCVDGVGLGARGRQAFTAPLTPLRSINKTNPFTVASNARWPGRPLSTLASLRRLSTLQMLGNRFAEFSQRTQQRVCDFFGVLGRLAARQFEVYLAQKTRRAVQLSQLYSVVYVWTVFESVVRLHAASLFRRASELAHRSRGKLFGLAAAVLATAECSAEDTISDAEMKRFGTGRNNEEKSVNILFRADLLTRSLTSCRQSRFRYFTSRFVSPDATSLTTVPPGVNCLTSRIVACGAVTRPSATKSSTKVRLQ